MTKTRKRILSLAMAMVMIFTLLPTTAFADETIELTAKQLHAISGDTVINNMTTMFDLASAALGLDGEYPKSLTFTGDGIDETIKMEEAAACEAVVSITAAAVYYDGMQVQVFSNGTASSLNPLNIHTEKVATYIFKDLRDNEISEAKQILKAGETLQVPAAPEKDHAIFTGWAYEVGGKLVYVTQGMTQATLTADVTYEVYPQFEDAYYVFFHDGSTVLKTVKVAKGGTISEADYNDACAAYTPTSGYVLSGWKIGGSTSGDVFTMATQVNEDLNVYPVESDSIFVTFDSQGGTPVPMTEVDANGQVVEPTAPTRIGYTFQYWSETVNGEPFDFNTQITADKTLYAIWKGNSGTNYTVIHWQENADYDNKYLPESQRDPEQYSFYLAESKTGVSGEMTEAAANTYVGFTAKPVTQMEIAGDGSTIVNIYYDRNVYEVKFYTNSGTSSQTCGKEEHTHKDGCYGCGKVEHSHNHDECCTKTKWHVFCNQDKCPFGYEHTHNRGCNIICGLEEHKHTLKCYTYSDQPQEIEQYRITAKYGADIRSAWPGMNWKTAPDSTTSQVNLFTMPLNGDEFYQAKKSQDTVEAYYYVEIIPGETVGSDVPTEIRKEKTYKLDHTDRSYGEGYSVTSEDRYPMKGFTCNTSLSPTNGATYDNAKFFYDRNSYDIVFVNGGNVGKTVSKKYEVSIADVSYMPDRPAGVSKDAIFAGWYDNEQCLGNAYIFAGKTMPAKNITLYAKWTTQPLTINVYASVDVVGSKDADKSLTLQVEVGSPLNKTDDLVAFEKRIGAEGNSNFLGWYLYDAETGTMTPFLFGTILNDEVTLVARWRNSGYQVTYNANGGNGTVPVDPMSYSAGASAKVMSGAGLSKGDEGFLYWTKNAEGTDAKFYPNQYIPVPQGGVTLYANYGKVAVSTVTVTYKANGGTGTDVKTSEFANNDQFTVGEYPASFTPPQGKEFDSWNTEANGTGTKYAAKETARADKSGENVLYAQYKVKYYTVNVTYKLVNENGEISDYTGTVDAGKSFQVAMGQSWTIHVGATSMPNYVAPEQLTTGTGSNAVKYVYDSAKTTDTLINSTATAVTLYYSKDVWDDVHDNETDGDGTPDYQQAVVKFVPADSHGTVGVTDEKTTQVFTLAKNTEAETPAYKGTVTPTTVTPNANKGYAFDIWTKDDGTASVTPFVAQLLIGGQTVTYEAHFDTDVIGGTDPENPGDGTPDKYQATVRYVSKDTNLGSVTVDEEVVTIRDNTFPIRAESGKATANGSVAQPGANGVFVKWTQSKNGGTAEDTQLSAATGQIKLTNVNGGDIYTFNAVFEAKNSKIDVEKELYQIVDADGKVKYTGPKSDSNPIPMAVVGDTIVWKITVENKGNQDLSVAFSDELSLESRSARLYQIGSIYGGKKDITGPLAFAAGMKDEIWAEYTVQSGDEGKTIYNTITAEVDGETGDRDTAPDSVVVEKKALTVDKTVSATSAKVGDTITYTITVKNSGNVTLTGIKLTDELLDIKDADLGNLKPDESLTKNYSYIVKASDVGTLTNTAVVTADDGITGRDTSDPTTVTKDNDDKETGDPHSLHFVTNGGSHISDISKSQPFDANPYDYIPTRPGYVFEGWYSDLRLQNRLDDKDIRVNGHVTVYAKWTASSVPGMLNGDDHFAYIQGYADGTVRPNNYITRAQVATIFFRLLDADVRDDNLTTYNDFPDVAEDYWANTAISTMTKLGVINGYKDGNFRPNAYITRAEFAAICARFDDTVKSGNSSFTDINGHWAKAEIERAATLGWIQGYSDGTFRPNNNITRAQAMTMINRVLCRLPEDEDDLLQGMNTWTDCNPGDWCYLAVQEATNSHDFQHRGVYESWTDLNRDPDWSKYEN